MAPTYRNQNRRQNRTGYVDHDVFEGLPVRQWRRDYTTVVPAPTQEPVTQNDIWAVELPHGMPKDSHLLPQHSQDLLRAARSGKIFKRPLPVEEEEVEVEVLLGDKPEKKDEDLKDKGWTAKTWKPVPRHLEGPDVEYLAKRRKGLITVAPKTASGGPTSTKATVKRIDAAGNEYVQDVVVPQGQKVEGEVISQTLIPSANPLGEAFAPTPPKRKGPVKRKLKGPGRGRKKNWNKPVPTSAPQPGLVDGVAQSVEGVGGIVGSEGAAIKNEENTNGTPGHNEDTEMADGSTHDSDDEDGDEGEEGDEDDEGSVDAQSSPSKPSHPLVPPPSSFPIAPEIPKSDQPDTEMAGLNEATRPPPLLNIEREKLEIKSGSPLKNVALTTSTLTSPLESPSTTAAAPFSEASHISELNPILETAEAEMASLDETMQQQTAETAPTTLPPPPPEPTIAEEIAATEVRQEEEEEEEMLLDIVENANNANIGGDPGIHPIVPDIPIESAPEPGVSVEETTPSVLAEPEPPAQQSEEPAAVEPTVVEEVHTEAPQTHEDDDDDFPDLLGGLEKQLNEPVSQATPPVAPTETDSAEKSRETAPAGDEKVVEAVEESTGGA